MADLIRSKPPTKPEGVSVSRAEAPQEEPGSLWLLIGSVIIGLLGLILVAAMGEM